MAKSKGFFSLRRGSTKSLTFSILNGKQITKDRVSEVRNPQTSRQMLQRVCFATVTQAAEKMLPIIGISQEGVTSEVDSRRRWISQNVKLLRGIADRMSKGGSVEAAFAPKGNAQLIPNSYQISKGSLALKDCLVPKIDSESGKSFSGTTYADINTLGYLVVGQSYTPGQLWEALFGIKPGDQLTFPQIFGEDFAQTLENANGNIIDCTRFTQFVAPRIVLLSEDSSETLTISADTTPADLQAALKTLIDTDATWYDMDVLLYPVGISAVSNGKREVTLEENYRDEFSVNNDDPFCAIGCIRSHKNENGKWQYSTSYMVCAWANSGVDSATGDYFGFGLANALDTYLANVTTDADGNFLQRGTNDTVVPSSFM